MILDEAQAIKSSSSAQWKTLLNFQCHNRLLLTGTPVENELSDKVRSAFTPSTTVDMKI